MNEKYPADAMDPIDPQLEVRLTALVMGEASDFERDQLQQLIADRPDVASAYQQLQDIHRLLQVVGAGELADADDEWKLSPDRRQAVMAALSGDRVEPARQPPPADATGRRSWKRLISSLAVVASVGAICVLLLGLMAPSVQMARKAVRREVASAEFFAQAEEPRVAANLSYSLPDAAGAAESQVHLFNTSPQQLDRARQLGTNADPGSALSTLRKTLAIGPNMGDVSLPASGPEPIVSKNPYAGQAWGDDGQSSVSALASGGGRFRNGAMGGYGIEAGSAAKAETENGRSLAESPITRVPSVPAESDLALNYESKAFFQNEHEELSMPRIDAFGREESSWATPRIIIPSTEEVMDFDRSLDGLVERPLTKRNSTADQRGRESEFNSLMLPPALRIELEARDYFSVEGRALERGERSQVPQQSGGSQVAGQDRSDFAKSALAPASPMDAAEIDKLSDIDADAPTVEFLQQAGEARGLPQLSDRERTNAPSESSGSTDGEGFRGQLGAMAGATQQGQLSGPAHVAAALEEDVLASNLAAGVELAETVGKQTRANGMASPSGEVSSATRKDTNLIRESLERKQATAGLDEISADVDPSSTFSLHVSDVSFKLAGAALSQGQWPEASQVRIEEFVNAFDYHDPLPDREEQVACRVEQAIHPFLLQRNLLRISMRTSATGRASQTPLRLTILIDNSGSMERPDRRQTLRRAFEALVQQLQPADQVTLLSFSSRPRLLADQMSGDRGDEMLQIIDSLPSEGGTNIEAALQLAMEKAVEQQMPNAQNRIVLVTDGAVNLGDADPESLSTLITTMRDTGIAFDAAGICARDLNDAVLAALTRQGDGRYYLLDSAETVSDGFADQIAGALRPSAKNVKVQIEFNPARVERYKLLGFEQHRLQREDFRNDQVDAAEMAAAEAGVAVYQFEAKPDGQGDVGTVSVRFRDLATGEMVERSWPIPYAPGAPRVDQANPSLRIATVAAMFAAALRGEPLADNVDLSMLASLLAGLPPEERNNPRVQQLQTMIEQARQLK